MKRYAEFWELVCREDGAILLALLLKIIFWVLVKIGEENTPFVSSKTRWRDTWLNHSDQGLKRGLN